MANISVLSRLIGSVQRNVDLSANTLVVGALNTGTNTLTDAILGRLISLQNGTDVGATYHSHDSLYTRSTALASATPGSAGSTLIGDNNSYTHFTPATATVKGALSAIDAVLGSAASALDGTFRIQNTTDPTKKIAFDASGIATGTTHTITMPNSDVNLGLVATAIQANGSVPFTASQSLGGFNLTNLANAVSAQDAVTLSQLQTAQAGIDWKQHVRAMADSNITLSGTQTIDSVALIAGDRVLVQNQTIPANNGIYVVAAGAWSRSSDATTSAQLVAASTYVDEGTNYKGSAWVQTAPSPITVGTTAITFVKFATILPLIFRNGLTQTGQNIDVTPGDTSLTSTANSLVVNLASGGAIVTASGLKINLEASNPTLQISSNQLGVKLDGARAITTGAAGIGVNVDNSTLAIAANAVKVKPAGITNTEIAASAYDQSTIAGGAGTVASVLNAPSVKRTLIAGQSFAANTTFALRWGVFANGETAGRVYAADITTTSFDLFYVIGIFNSGSAVTAGQSISVTTIGAYAQGTSDTAFSNAQVGLPAFLAASGAISATAPTTSGQAVTRIGMISSTTTIDVFPVVVGVA
jgi:hypothetical protein